MVVILLFTTFQKENKETLKREFIELLTQLQNLVNFTHWNEKLGVKVRNKTYFTMVDSGAVNKATDNDDQHKCRVCLQRPWDVRNMGNGISDHVHFCIELNMPLIAFGPSPYHFVIHLGMYIHDLANRRESQAHTKRGFAELHRNTEKIVHDEILALLGIHVSSFMEYN